jgi:hypothetical protein
MVIAAIVAWFVVAAIFTLVSPVGDAVAQLAGALALGSAVGLTLWPLLWSPRRREHGALAVAARRSALAAIVVASLVVLRANDVAILPVGLFLLVGAVLVELAFTLRR